MSLAYFAAFAISLAACIALTPVARNLALKLNVVDVPSSRKLHTDSVPYLGGLAIIAAFCAALGAGALILDVRPAAYGPVGAILGGAFVFALVGLWDDLKVVPGWIKVPLELLLGVAFYIAGSKAQLFDWWPINLLVTMAWTIGIVNAVNYMDNMDGLSSGTVAIASGFFAVLSAMNGQFLVASLAAALAGCTLGFLWHNRPPARIFMGDAGSLFLGVILAGLGLELEFDNISRVTFFVPVAILAIPVLDALMVSVSRVRRGLSPIHPGKDHISHRLVKIGVPPPRAVGYLWFAGAACGWIGMTIAFSRPITAYMLMAWMIVVAAFAGVLFLKVEV